MASLNIGLVCKPTCSLRSSGAVERSSSPATGAQASKFLRICNLEKNNSAGFQQRRYDNQSFYERFTLQQRRKEKFVPNATLASNLESDATHDSSSPIESTTKFMVALNRFIRPYAAPSTILSVFSAALLAVEKMSDISPFFITRILKILAAGIFMQMYMCGFNQICDIELDKVNKPYLPLVTGELSMRNGVIISSLSAIMSLSLIWTIGSMPLFWVYIGWFIVGTAYSANVLPLLRWKRFPFSAALYMLVDRVVIPVAYYIHMKNSIHGVPALISRPTIFALGMLILYSISIIFLKDIPDMEGDKMHGIKSLALKLGETQVFWGCIWVLEIAYVAAIIVGASSPVPWSKYITIIGHMVMASVLWIRAKSVDLKDKDNIQSMYLFLWQLLSVEYCLFPLVR